MDYQEEGVLCTRDIARLQNVSQYRTSGTVPSMGSSGRPRRPITGKQVSAALSMYRENPCGLLVLEALLNRHGLKVPHNTVHRILKDHNLASNDALRQKGRKWVKYEKRHSMSLWHTDWYQIKDDRWRGKDPEGNG